MIAEQVDSAIADPAVRAIVLDIDSPGGRTSGLFDLTEHLYSLRGNGKPIWACANEQATSAAYAIASTAERIFASRGSVVGSIGVLCTHVDWSDYDKQLGIRITEIASGERKTDMSPHKRLSARGRETFEKIVNVSAEQFFEAVALHRGLSVDAVRAQDAGVFVGAEGIEAGLVDQIASLNEVLSELREQLDAGRSSARPSPNGLSFAAASAAAGSEPAPPPGGSEMSLPNPTDPAAAAAAAAGAQPATPAAAGAQPVPASAALTAQQIAEAAVAAERQRSTAITELCALAGRPELAGTLISRNVSADQVRAHLLAERAGADAALQPVLGNLDPLALPAGRRQKPFNTAAIYDRWNNPAALYNHGAPKSAQQQS